MLKENNAGKTCGVSWELKLKAAVDIAEPGAKAFGGFMRRIVLPADLQTS